MHYTSVNAFTNQTDHSNSTGYGPETPPAQVAMSETTVGASRVFVLMAEGGIPPP